MTTILKAPGGWTVNDLLYSILRRVDGNLVTAPGGITATDILWSLIQNSPTLAITIGDGTILLLGTVTDYTGGGPTKLDGLETVDIVTPQLVAFEHATLGGKLYWLHSGTTPATTPPDYTIIRPLDYHAVDNPKYYKAFM